MDAKVQLLLANSVSELGPALDRIESVLTETGADDQIVFRIRLALDELLTNSITHGFPQGGEHEIRIDLMLDPDHVAVDIIDDGLPFDPFQPRQVDIDAPIEERAIGGLGLHFVRELIPELSYRRVGDHNIVSLASPLQQVAGG